MPLTLAMLDEHDCIIYFKTTIEQLKEENEILKKELAQLKGENTEVKQILPLEPICINYQKYGSNFTSSDVSRKLQTMVEAVQSFEETIQTSDFWGDCSFLRLLKSFVPDNENAKNIFTLTDIRPLYNHELRLNCSSNVFNKTNSTLLIHVLLFDLLG